jgi:MerR family copper efflux transcriptional regulator
VRIGELAEISGLTTKTIRFYEDAGLLAAPARSPNGYRDDPPAAVSRLGFVRTAQAAGLSLAEIAEVLAIRDDGRAPCTHVATVVDTRLREIRRRIRVLRTAQRELERLAERAAAFDPADCTSADDVCRILTDR